MGLQHRINRLRVIDGPKDMDARGLMDWLVEREKRHGLRYETFTDADNAIDVYRCSTDSDPAMTAAADHMWPKSTAHLLCSNHTAQNLKTHFCQLFSGAANYAKRRELEELFYGFLSRRGTAADAASFESDWREMLRKVDAVTPCPWGLPDEFHDANDTFEDDELGQCKAVLDASFEDEERAKTMEFERLANKGRKTAAHLGWLWLQSMCRRRERWGKAFVMKHFTAGTFST